MSDAPQSGSTRSFGRYRVARLLGAGGMGQVFLAHDELLGRDVAIKTLSVPGFEAAAGEEFRARFLNEARAIAALSHPNVVQVFDIGFEGETPYLVMEVVGGLSLRERLKEGRRLSFSEARALGIQLGGALGAAHARGIIHRDVKPANLLEAEPGVWKLADFGVARTPDSTLTAAGQFLGSPAYAAPEALVLGRVSPATDVFGLGATLYEALCGETPFGDPRQADLEVIVKGREAVAIGVRCPGIPAELARVVMQAIAHEAAARPTAARLAEELAGAPPAATVVAAPAHPATVVTGVAAAASVADATRPGVPRALQSAASASPAPASSLQPPAPVAPPRRSRTPLVVLVVVGVVVVVGLGVGLSVGAYLSAGPPPISPALGPQADARPAPELAPVAPPPPAPTPVTQADAGAPTTPPVGVDAAPTAVRDAAAPPHDAPSPRQEQRRRIRRALDQGRLQEAQQDLEVFVQRYPEDTEGRRLLEDVKVLQSKLGGGQAEPEKR